MYHYLMMFMCFNHDLGGLFIGVRFEGGGGKITPPPV